MSQTGLTSNKNSEFNSELKRYHCIHEQNGSKRRHHLRNSTNPTSVDRLNLNIKANSSNDSISINDIKLLN